MSPSFLSKMISYGKRQYSSYQHSQPNVEQRITSRKIQLYEHYAYRYEDDGVQDYVAHLDFAELPQTHFRTFSRKTSAGSFPKEERGYLVVGFFLDAKADHTPGLNTVTSMTTATITIIPMVKSVLNELTGLAHQSPSCCIRPFG